jgi:hypothetical protein
MSPPRALLTRGLQAFFLSFPVLADNQSQPVRDKRSKGPPFRGSFASRSVENVFREADGSALCHMSRHI